MQIVAQWCNIFMEKWLGKLFFIFEFLNRILFLKIDENYFKKMFSKTNLEP